MLYKLKRSLKILIFIYLEYIILYLGKYRILPTHIEIAPIPSLYISRFFTVRDIKLQKRKYHSVSFPIGSTSQYYTICNFQASRSPYALWEPVHFTYSLIYFPLFLPYRITCHWELSCELCGFLLLLWRTELNYHV